MNGTTIPTDRSVQRAVMATPTASVVEAVAEARRRHGTAAASIRRIFDSMRTQPATMGGAA